MDAGVIVGILGTVVSGIIGIAGVVIARSARRDAKRSTQTADDAVQAAKRSANAAEQQVVLTRQRIDAAAARANPRVDLRVLRSEPYQAMERGGFSFVVSMNIENRSSEPDVLENVAATFNNTQYSVRAGAAQLGGGDLPLPLAPEKPVRLSLVVAPRNLTLSEGSQLSAVLTVTAGRAGDATDDFVIFQR